MLFNNKSTFIEKEDEIASMMLVQWDKQDSDGMHLILTKTSDYNHHISC